MNASLVAMLYVPGADEGKLAKVGRLDAAAYILDLEDAVAPSVKPLARELVAATLDRCGAAASPDAQTDAPSRVDAAVWVRVNPEDSGLLVEDLDAVVRPGLAGVVLPKAESAADVRAVDALLALLERRCHLTPGSVALMPTIETVAGLAHVDEIASASSRIVCLGFGAGDFSLDLGLDWPPPGELSHTLLTAKVEIVLASRRNGLAPPHDGVFPNFRAPDRLRAEAEKARALGFSGKHAIHPSQLAVIRAVFDPSAEQLADARAVLDAYDAGLREGRGGVHIDGRFVDAPVAEHARRVLAGATAEPVGEVESAPDAGPVSDAGPNPGAGLVSDARRHSDDGGTAPDADADAAKAASGAPAVALPGVRVLDLSSLYAAPLIATNLGDFGADVIKVEHPRGDDARRWGLAKDGVPLWWKTISRNKRVIALDLNDEADRDVVRALAVDADVLIENFRPGRLERWGLGPDALHAENPGLVFVRVTGFGQTGPYSDRPGFGTLAEAFSGFAHMTGQPDGPPTLPPFGLADAVCGLAGTYAVLAALYWRDAVGGRDGQVIDLSLYEPLFSALGPQVTEFTALGVVQNRQGNRSLRTSPRNAYPTADGRWVAISGGTQQIADRVMAAVDRPELASDPRFRDAAGRRANADELDAIVAAWIAQRDLAAVLARFDEVQAPIAPVYDTSQIMDDPQYQLRESFVQLADPDLGEVTMPGIVPRLSRTPGAIRWTGPSAVGADTERVRGERWPKRDR